MCVVLLQRVSTDLCELCYQWLRGSSACDIMELVKAMVMTKGLGRYTTRLCGPCQYNHTPQSNSEWVSDSCCSFRVTSRPEELPTDPGWALGRDSQVPGVLSGGAPCHHLQLPWQHRQTGDWNPTNNVLEETEGVLSRDFHDWTQCS